MIVSKKEMKIHFHNFRHLSWMYFISIQNHWTRLSQNGWEFCGQTFNLKILLLIAAIICKSNFDHFQLFWATRAIALLFSFSFFETCLLSILVHKENTDQEGRYYPTQSPICHLLEDYKKNCIKQSNRWLNAVLKMGTAAPKIGYMPTNCVKALIFNVKTEPRSQINCSNDDKSFRGVRNTAPVQE